MSESYLSQLHKLAVDRIQQEVRSFYERGKPFRVYHGSTSSTRTLNFKRDAIVDTSNMNHIFPVDVDNRTVRAEPKVPMDALVQHTLKYGLVPKIVMEFKGITVGGGYSGFSGESSMYRYGLFNNTISEIEIVLGDGSVKTASRTRHADLLEHAAGSLGTFGIVTLLTIELIPAKPFVQVDVRLVDDVGAALDLFEEATRDDAIDFIDGVYFRKGVIIVMFGRFVDALPSGARALKKMEVHWFADTIEAIVRKQQQQQQQQQPQQQSRSSSQAASPSSASSASAPASVSASAFASSTVYLNTTDYLFRYDHGAFWGGKLAFQHFHVPQNALFKRLADPFLDSRTCYHALHKSGLANEYVVQDFGLPASTVKEFITFVNDTLPELQIFLAPCKAPRDLGLTSRFNARVDEVADQRIFAVGVYGRGPRDPLAFYVLNRKLELRSAELMGAKLLYARTYYTEDEFWLIYRRDVYEEMRRKYRAQTLPSVYQKLKADSGRSKRRPIRGVLETMWDKFIGNEEYLLVKK